MLPLALYLAESGHRLSAEDDALLPEAEALLRKKGVELRPFEPEEEVAFVYSSAIDFYHPARVFARKRGSVAMRRGECLAVIAREKRLIAVTGSHGKTTTCGMLIDILDTAGVKIDFLLGARFDGEQPYRVSGSEWLVAEIDESDGTIDLFSPDICVVLNADHDHHSRYETEEEYLQVFERLVQRTRFLVIAENGLRDDLSSAAEYTSAKMMWLELRGNESELPAVSGDVSLSFEVAGPGWSRIALEGEVVLEDLLVNRTGAMTLLDAGFATLAANACGAELGSGQSFEFRAVRRRQRCRYLSPRAQIFEDYAHHPREIEVALELFGEKEGWRSVVVFQPHRYSRTLELKGEIAASLAPCDTLCLLEVYAASESPLEGGTGEDLLAACREQRSDVSYFPDTAELIGRLTGFTGEGPVRILFLGAGTGDRLAGELGDLLVGQDGVWGPVYAGLAEGCSFASEIRENEPLAPKTTMRVGGAAERYFEPHSLAELRAALRSCSAAGVPAHLLGRGSNLVVPDEGVSGLVIRLSHPIWSRVERLDDRRLRVGAGLRIKALCSLACKEGLEGLEFLEGIPGNVGGVLRMNAGAMGGWVFDVVESIRYVNGEGEILEADKESLEIGYRYCRELEDAVAIDAVFVSRKAAGDSESIRRTLDTYQSRRKGSQPREPSAGCIFKNPQEGSAGKLIDELGLKGAAVGGAEVSLTHGNFIVNRGGATCRDVLELVGMIRKVARERRGVELHPEAQLFGSSWNEE